MYSRNSDAIVELYSGFLARLEANPEMPMTELRSMMEHWGDITDEPGAVDYLETTVREIPALMALPAGCGDQRAILCVHGGGYCVGSMHSHRKLFGHIAKALRSFALIIDYRRAPEHIFPAQVEDTLSAYEHLLDEGWAPENIILVGDSAGGCIAVSTLIALRDQGVPAPAGAICMSPWFDPKVTGKSAAANANVDCFVKKEVLQSMALGALGAQGSLEDSRLNLLESDLSDLPPIYVQVGGSEVLLDDALRFKSVARNEGNEVDVEVFPDMQHVFQLMAGRSTEADHAICLMAEWAQKIFEQPG